MHNEILKSKFGFTTGGVTTYEFASMNVPFVVICDDLHQIPTAREWDKKNAGINLGFLNNRTSKKITKVVKKNVNFGKIHLNSTQKSFFTIFLYKVIKHDLRYHQKKISAKMAKNAKILDQFEVTHSICNFEN